MVVLTYVLTNFGFPDFCVTDYAIHKVSYLIMTSFSPTHCQPQVTTGLLSVYVSILKHLFNPKLITYLLFVPRIPFYSIVMLPPLLSLCLRVDRFPFQHCFIFSLSLILLVCIACKQHTVDFFFFSTTRSVLLYIGGEMILFIINNRGLVFLVIFSHVLLHLCFCHFFFSFCDFNEYYIYLLLSFPLMWKM